MINGVLHPGQLSPSIFTQPRSAPPATRASSSREDSAPAEPRPAGQDHETTLRDYQMLGLAARKFSEILPRIESLDVPIE